jgi:iron complex outermembrane receptor protein
MSATDKSGVFRRLDRFDRMPRADGPACPALRWRDLRSDLQEPSVNKHQTDEPSVDGPGSVLRMGQYRNDRRTYAGKWLLLTLASAFWFTMAAQAKPSDSGTNWLGSTDLSLDQLINIKVTSVSKKETFLEDSPAAVTVVTQDEIRRYGITSLPDALRLVPGMDVARINSHEWAVSSRGFTDEFANKMLVLVDGRSIYTTGFGGVIWGMEDVVMEDLDRIEVIRGPGGALWGANAVNGVINVITKSAKDTQGGLISTSVGTEDQPSTTIRYGGVLATNLYFRVYLKYFNRDGLVEANGTDAPDPWSGVQGGFRMDWEPTEADKLTLQGDCFSHRSAENQSTPSLLPPFAQTSNVVNHDSGGNLLGRWTHDISENSSLSVQAYYDRFSPEQIGVNYSSDTFDLDAQHRFEIGSRNDIVWGLGYRHISDKLEPSAFLSFNPEAQHEDLFSSFVQDEVTHVPDRFKVTLGTKFEHNDFTGFEIQPNVRVLWTPTEHQTFWASVSRAVRTPSVSELYERVNYQVLPPSATTPPVLVSLFGSQDLKSEELLAYELGYRVEPVKHCSLDFTGFYNDYNRLIAGIPGAPQLITSPPLHVLIPTSNENAGGAQSFGVEASGRYDVTDYWHLAASWSWCEINSPLSSSLFLEATPEQQFQVRSALNLPCNLEFNAAAYYVDQIQASYGTGQLTIPSYVRLDLGLVWHASKSLEIGIWGQNLLDGRHAEFTSYKTPLITEIPRSVVGKITWRF